MNTIHSFSDQLSRQATVASVALTHAAESFALGFGNRHASVSPAKSGFGYPAGFAVGRSNPNLNASGFVINLKHPLGLELIDVCVWNHESFERIDNQEICFAKHELWSNPQKVCGSCNKNRHGDVNREATEVLWVKNELNYKKCIKDDGKTGIEQIALWAKYSVHASIIAGKDAVGIGNQK